LLIFYKAETFGLKHAGLIEIYRQLHLLEGDQEDRNPAVKDFKAQVELT